MVVPIMVLQVLGYQFAESALAATNVLVAEVAKAEIEFSRYLQCLED